MTSRIPDAPSAWEADGVPDTGQTTAGQTDAGDDYDGMDPPSDDFGSLDAFGTTAEEQREGEPLDLRLSHEEPDVLSHVDEPADESEGNDTPYDERAGQGVGRLVAPDEGVRTDTEKDMVAADAGTDLGGYTNEESAMHLEPEV